MGLNSVLHKMAEAVGMNRSHPVHDEIDEAVKADKTDEPGEEENTNAQE
jgi:hypothetical protein